MAILSSPRHEVIDTKISPVLTREYALKSGRLDVKARPPRPEVGRLERPGHTLSVSGYLHLIC